MTAEGHHVASLTGALEGAQRDAIIDRFRTGAAKVLITTNVLARGIDVQSVSMVINYVRSATTQLGLRTLTIARMCRSWKAWLIPRLTCTASVARVGSDALVWLSRSSMIRSLGGSSWILQAISGLSPPGSALKIGITWRKPSSG